MSEIKVGFTFNTALSGVNPADGGWDKDRHKQIATQIRGRIMSRLSGDGISGMNIWRYDMEVEFRTEVTDRATVAQAVSDAIAWAADNVTDSFPLRGTKKPTATLDEPTPQQPTGQVMVRAYLPTDLFVQPTSQEETTAIKKRIAEELVRLDGVRNYDVFRNCLSLTVRTSVSSVDAAKDHMSRMVKRHALDKASDIMPFSGGQVVEITWEIQEIMQ